MENIYATKLAVTKWTGQKSVTVTNEAKLTAPIIEG